jgi:serine O-acetyltransferase
MHEIWTIVRAEARGFARASPGLRGLLEEAVLQHAHGEAALVNRLARRLDGALPGYAVFRDMLAQAFGADPALVRMSTLDLKAVAQRDPACDGLCSAFLFYKGFHPLQVHRAAHWYWQQGERFSARVLQHRVAELMGIDIHPAVPVGGGVLLDHGTGFVAGETAVIGDNVNLLHGITLGGTGKQAHDRHPKIGAGVSIGAHAIILGNITIGSGARIGAGAVVLAPVDSDRTAVGSPARMTRRCLRDEEYDTA